MIVAVAPRRRCNSFTALLSIRLNWTFSLRRLSPDSVSTWPSRLRSTGRSGSALTAGASAAAVSGSGFGGA